MALRFRLEEEVARVRRAGGFLSRSVIRIEAGPTAPEGDPRPARVARRLRASVRLHDVLAWHRPGLALMMPETSGSEAVRAMERLLGLEALGLGAVMFVHKPMSAADLDSALQMFRELVPGVVRRTR